MSPEFASHFNIISQPLTYLEFSHQLPGGFCSVFRLSVNRKISQLLSVFKKVEKNYIFSFELTHLFSELYQLEVQVKEALQNFDDEYKSQKYLTKTIAT